MKLSRNPCEGSKVSEECKWFIQYKIVLTDFFSLEKIYEYDMEWNVSHLSIK